VSVRPDVSDLILEDEFRWAFHRMFALQTLLNSKSMDFVQAYNESDPFTHGKKIGISESCTTFILNAGVILYVQNINELRSADKDVLLKTGQYVCLKG
jgi:hypothetical protein